MRQSSHSNVRVIIGLVILALGVLMLLDNLDIIYFDLPFEIFRWQNILILIGVILLASSRNFNAGIILISIGLIFHFPEFWPLILVALGLYIILRKSNSNFHKTKPEQTSKDFNSEELNEVSIFGGGKKYYRTESFTGGKITAIFGGSELNLMDCNLAEGEHTLDLFMMFGGATLLIPSSWKIEIDLIPIFGGFSDSRRKDPNLVEQPGKVLKIKGLVIFGGGEIKN